MKSVVEPLEGNKVKVSVEVDEAEFDKAIDSAFKKIAHEVRLPGFRPGKAPRRVLEARIGIAPAREQALRDAIPQYLARAVSENDVDIIAAPEVDITAGESDGPVAFDAVIEVRPKIMVPGYAGLRVEIPHPVPTDADIDAQIDRMRQPFAELNEASRGAVDGDVISIDITGRHIGEDDAFFERSDLSYEVGTGSLVEDLDENVRGKAAGDSFDFEIDHADHDHPPMAFSVTVKVVNEKVLPAVDDEWVKEASEFDTVAELRADLVKRLTMLRAAQSQMAVRDRAAAAIVDLVDDDAPEVMVNDEMRRQIENLAMRLQAQGANLEQYLAAIGKDQQEFIDELREGAARSVKLDLALRAVADAEQLAVDDDELDEELERIAQQTKEKKAAVRRAYERNDALGGLRSDLRKRKAMEWLVDHVEVVDPEGNPIDRNQLVPSTDDDGPDMTEQESTNPADASAQEDSQ
ncbi:MAG: trigger factor [Acidimicrobiia bacterium]